MFRLVIFLGLFITLQQSAFAWWNEEWAFRKVITIDTTETGLQIVEEVDNINVLVRLHTGNFGYFFDIREGGADLRFMAADDTTPLKHHLEMLDPINELAIIWVKVPKVAVASTDKIFMYYGNPAAVTANDVTGTFDESLSLVLHFDDADTPQDKTYNANHPVASSTEISKASLMGQGVIFDGSNGLQFAASPSLNLSSETGWTFSSWVKPDAEIEDVVIFEYKDVSGTLSLRQQGLSLVSQWQDTSGTITSTATAPMLLGDWQHVAVTVLGTQVLLYINGQNPISIDVPALTMFGELTVGNTKDALTAEPVEDDTEAVATGFVGEMDELRVAQVARSAAWLALSANVQGKSAKMLIYGGDESQETEGSAEEEGGHGAGHFAIIIQNVFGNDDAIIEQVVIGFCGFMAIVAFLIMFFKTYTLFSARGSSRKFLDAYQTLGADANDIFGLADAEKSFGGSPLFRVYRQGLQELEKRMQAGDTEKFQGLEMKSINAIRSSLDATMVREGQSINSYIVLLTIAISGGPFIGLLGTVVGVMVTFAGIAAAGEVNINAIAPGMAAALLATVAGLGVAIPALFGYNYLGAQIRELVADMHVFADEFTARMAESFGK